MAGKPRYEVVPSGWAESPLKDRSQAPRQGNLGAPPAWLVFESEVTEGIRDLRAGTEIMVLTWLDRSRRDVLVTRPGDNPHSPPAGVFSTRSPGRPNPIGLHRVRDHGRRITGSRARPGALDGTPLADAKTGTGQSRRTKAI
jgi:tRNA (Thr-GGU) A37 N-methylase